MKKVKHNKLPMSSPAQNADPKGGPGGSKNSPRLHGSGGGKGTKKHLVMDGPDLTGGGWGGSK